MLPDLIFLKLLLILQQADLWVVLLVRLFSLQNLSLFNIDSFLQDNGTFYASFQPDEAGEWRIHVTYDNEDIENSPFKCMVFDPRAIFVSFPISMITMVHCSVCFQIPDQDGARKAKPGDPFTFTVDALKTGWGEVAIDVVYENKSIRRTFYVEEVRDRVYQVTFTPQARGKHRVYIYLNGMEVDWYQKMLT